MIENNDIVIWYQFKDINGQQVITQDYKSIPLEIRQSNTFKELEIWKKDIPYILKYYDLWITCIFNTNTLTFNTEPEIMQLVKEYQKKKLDEIVYSYLQPTDWIIIKISEQMFFDTTEYVEYLKNKYKTQIDYRKKIRYKQKEVEEIIENQNDWRVIQLIGDYINDILENKVILSELLEQFKS